MTGMVTYLNDKLTNLVSGLGTSRDKAAGNIFGVVTQNDAELAAAYDGAWLPQKIVDIPAMDACRMWRNWQASDTQIEDIEDEEKRLGVQAKVLEAKTWARLFGGAAILIGDGSSNPSEPLNIDRISKGGIKYLNVFTRQQCVAGEIDLDLESEFYGKPKDYTLTGLTGSTVAVHPSRLVIFLGPKSATDACGGGHGDGWGKSALLPVMDAIKNMDGTAGNIASLVFEAKVDVVKIPNFMSNIGNDGYAEKVLARWRLAMTGKGINGALMIDAEEDYQQKSANFANLPAVLDRFMQIVSGAADIPATRLLGQSPAGMSATGESDLRNYYDRVAVIQSLEMEPAMVRLDECLIRSATGARDKAIHFIWASLWQITDKERADIGKIDAETIKTLQDTQLIPDEALSHSAVNMLVEHSIMPGLEAHIEEFGGFDEPVEETETQVITTGDAKPRTLYVRRDVLNADEVLKWAKEQGFSETLSADDMHVTIAFSRRPVDWMKAGEAWDDELKVKAGGPRLIEQFGKAKVLIFASSQLQWRHDEFKREGASWDHPEYQPHITISYAESPSNIEAIEPYQGEIILGPEMFEEVNEDWTPKN